MVERMPVINATRILSTAGIVNPWRLVAQIREMIDFLNLDLSGLTILTEAATGPYVVTPVIAVMSGAEKVYALTGDSCFGTAQMAKRQTRALETISCGKTFIEIVTERTEAVFAAADIVTNLGFVRPIDAPVVKIMKSEAVVPLMCESWEVRPADVDLASCLHKGISVAGTNEDFTGLDVFSYSGWLCLKMLMEAQVDVKNCRCLIISSDKFGRTIGDRLATCGIDAELHPHLRDASAHRKLAEVDALIIADYKRKDTIIGRKGDLQPVQIKNLSPSITVLQFAGRIDLQELKNVGVSVFPGVEMVSQKMVRTLADLGPYPVVGLHAAGLKVGQLLFEKNISGRFQDLVQEIDINEV